MRSCWERGTRYAGVYMIKNRHNGKVYIGSSNDIETRLRTHLKGLQRGKHPNKKMQEDFNAGHKFTVFVLYCEPVRMLTRNENRRKYFALEGKYIRMYNAIETGYNEQCTSKIFEERYG